MDPPGEPVISSWKTPCQAVQNGSEFLEYAGQNFRNPQLGIVTGMLAAFAVYFVVLEELHWRIHLGEWLPGFLSPARVYHLAHHDRPDGRYNVFFPLFDWLLGTVHSLVTAGRKPSSPLG